MMPRAFSPIEVVEMVEGALEAANHIRAELKRPPVDHLYPGNVGMAGSCPITNTVYDDDLDRDTYEVLTDTFSVQAYAGEENAFTIFFLPRAARRFVWAFDAGCLPEFIETRKVV